MKARDIHEYYFHDFDSLPEKPARREFLKKLGGGIVVVFSANKLSFASGSEAEQDFPEFNAFLQVKEDGRVNCFTGKIEMGQGINTSLAQVLADELDVAYEKVDMIMGDTELTPYDAGTWGSLTHRQHDKFIRAAAAEARLVLLQLASEELNVPLTQLKVVNGVVSDKNNPSKNTTYENLTKGKKIIRSVNEKAEPKTSEKYKVIGQSFLRRDAVEKVTGAAKYSADIKLPGMMYAKILRPPAHNAERISMDTTAAEAIDGVRFLKEDDFVVVLHAHPEIAEKALTLIKASWKVPSSKANDETIFEHILNNADESRVRHEGGSLATGKNESYYLFEHEYHDGYKAHAPIETHAATALFESGKLTLWASSQTPFGTRDEVAGQLGLTKENVHVTQIFIGGGFGGKISIR